MTALLPRQNVDEAPRDLLVVVIDANRSLPRQAELIGPRRIFLVDDHAGAIFAHQDEQHIFPLEASPASLAFRSF